VAALAQRGIRAEGIDPDPGMVAEAQGNGRPVHLGDGIEYLRGLPPHSLGAIVSVHVVEHLPLPVLVELLELAASRLVPGGLFVAETPNPMSLIVLGNSYILDPTHVWPLHPSLMTFLAERAGFRDVELSFYSPAEAYRLEPIDAGPDAPPWVDTINDALGRLNDVLFGPQEYATIARTPPA
jgi:SAM-dependent methyltransferase